jgi:hypothetical protein
MGAVVAVLLATAAAADERALPFTDGHWTLQGQAVVERADGRDVLSLQTGTALRSDVKLQDGSIDFDVQLTRRRSFVYVFFRVQDEREHEEFYLRPHKSGLPDATQYAPVYQGQSAWQLYHGPGGATAAFFEPGAWTHVRVVLQGRRAALFVGDMTHPVLLVPRLAREPQPGSIGLNAFLPAGTPGDGPIARYANVTVRPDVVPFDFASVPTPTPEPGPGVIRAWAVSPLLTPVESAVPAAPAFAGATRADVEPQGFLNLHRVVTLPAGARAGNAAARVHVRSAAAGVRTLDLGWSDVATVFLNGRPIFQGDHHYTYDMPRREGLLGFDQARVFLPLQAGDNELVVQVSDVFGGWAVMGRFADPSGLTIEAR